MQIIFDTSHDSKLDLKAGILALATYYSTRFGEYVYQKPEAAEPQTGPRNVIQGGVEFDEKDEAVAIHQTSLDDPLIRPRPDPVDGTTAQPLSFTPGDVSGSAPSPAGAAQLPIAHEEPADGVPMPPTVASVPAPPTVAPGAPAGLTTPAPSGDVDSAGLPWDKRIHSSSKAKNADGSWRKLRGLNDGALVARVEAELRARGAVRQAIEGSPEMMEVGQMFAAPATDLMSGQPLPTGGYVPAPPPMAAGGTAANVPPPPVTPVAAPPAPAAPDALTYDGFLSWVTPKMMDGSTPFDKVAAALSASGVSSLHELRDNPAAIPAVYQALGGA